MMILDIDRPIRYCVECPMYNHSSDYCQQTGRPCKYTWILTDSFTEEDRNNYIKQICPITIIDEKLYDDILLTVAKSLSNNII